ncbi:MAG: hypothetical protein OEX00_08095, partial [Gammaproteobacteria bacterium]|nr:hypothetical protein [Gammaproteobacteria bacterium]
VDESLEFKTTKIYDAVNYEMISENTGAAVYPVYSKEFAGRIESFFGVPNTNSALVVAEDNSAEVKVLHLDETAKEDTLIFRDALRVIF